MSNDLFWALLGVGSVAVVAVAALNAWQARKLRRALGADESDDQAAGDLLRESSQSASKSRADDFDDFQQPSDLRDFTLSKAEPSFSAAEVDGLEPAITATASNPPSRSPSAHASESGRQVPRAAAIQEAILDDATDGLALFELADPLPGERLQPIAQSHRRVGGKPVMFEGQLVGESSWTPLAMRGQWHRVRAGVLLANRNGPLNAVEWTEFVQVMQGVADIWNAELSLSDGAAILDQARQLDRYCAELDAQLGLNVRLNQAVNSSTMAATCAVLGLVERGANRYAAVDDKGQLMFSVSLGDSPNTVALLLDVPRAPHAARPYERMVQTALAMAHKLEGVVVDDQNLALDEAALATVGAQLQERYAQLAASGMPAGSPRALRLFN